MWAYDDDPCPAREPGLKHIEKDGTCPHCGIVVYRREREIAPAPDPRPDIDGVNPVPVGFKPDYLRLRREGFSDRDAQALLALRSGLSPGEGQKKPWTLRELVRLMFHRDRTAGVDPWAEPTKREPPGGGSPAEGSERDPGRG